MKPKQQISGAGSPVLQLALLLALAVLVPNQLLAVGSWSALANTAADSVSSALLLSDGTIMAANNPNDTNGDTGNIWYRLTPSSTGSYANGTWSTRAPMSYSRLFYSSCVLQDGRVFVAGGEYGTGAATAEIYNPTNDSWTTVNPPTSVLDPTQNSPTTGRAQGIIDAECKVLPNGNVLVAPISPKINKGTLIYNPTANTWSAGPATRNWVAESGFVKLPDGSLLTVDPDSTSSERYIPSLNVWTNDGVVPVSLWATLAGYVGETGPAFLLPDGRAVFFGGSGHTALYTPSGNNSAGNWVQGPDIPSGLVSADAPGAMMFNGKILLAVSPAPYESGGNPQFPTPTYFYEYNYNVGTTGAFTQVSSPTGGLTDSCASYQSTMLDLPDGTVLYCHIQQYSTTYSAYGKQLYVYTPDGSPLAAGKPTISSITANGDGTYHLTGTLLNGISEGAAYGDDHQMDSSYPLVRATDGSGNVTYLRTYNWSSTQVMTGGTTETTEFSAANLVSGNYSLVVVANGIASDPWPPAGALWVDFNYSGILQLGTFDLPDKTLTQAVTAVPTGGTINIKPGTSLETFSRITKAMELRAVGGSVKIGGP